MPKENGMLEIDDLTVETFRKYCSPVDDYGKPTMTDKECFEAVQFCKAKKLNPILGEVHFLKKYSTTKKVCRVVAYEEFLKRARKNPDYQGYEIKWEEGNSTCLVHIKGYMSPIPGTAYSGEFEQRNKNGDLTGLWAKMPKTMQEKCSIAIAHRRAFPDDFQGLYTREEIDQDNQNMIGKKINTFVEQPKKISEDVKPEEQAPKKNTYEIISETYDSPEEQAPEETVSPPKRKRRTKAEMEAAKTEKAVKPDSEPIEGKPLDLDELRIEVAEWLQEKCNSDLPKMKKVLSEFTKNFCGKEKTSLYDCNESDLVNIKRNMGLDSVLLEMCEK